MDIFDRYLERVKHLPPAPAVLPQLRALLGDPNRDTELLAELISYDPSLTAEVLKRSNSAFFRGAEPALDVMEAMSRLGSQEVQYVVSTSIGSHGVPQAQIGHAVEMDSFWRHSVTTAMAAATLAGQGLEPESKAFTAGLLHDVGKLVFGLVLGNPYADFTRRFEASGAPLAQAEKADWGVNHAELGSRLLTRWGLPGSFTIPILHHHERPSAASPFERSAANLHLANLVAHQLTDSDAALPELSADAQEAAGLLSMTPQDLQTVADETRERLRRAYGILQITA
jgi:HD-like signal output (HDOD) protein